MSYVGSKDVDAISSSDFFFDCKKVGYNFRGWSYNGVKIFDETGKQLLSPTMKSTMTFVAVFANDAKMTITTNMEEAGSIKGEGYYEYNTDVNVLAETNQGYNFLGWYDADGIPLSSQKSYNYRMSECDITIEARFELARFTLDIKSNNGALGVVCIDPTASTSVADYDGNASKLVTYTHDVKIAANTKTDTRFLGWFDEDSTLVSTNPVYNFTMPNHDYHLEAKWNSFAIHYELNGGTNNPSNPSSLSTEEEVILSNPTRDGYVFKGWFSASTNEKVTDISIGTLTDVYVYAKWEPIVYSISYHLNGGINDAQNPSSYTVEDSILLNNPSRQYFTFVGWYSDETFSNKVSRIAKGTIGDKAFYAKWAAIKYSITYELNGGINNAANPSSYTFESDNIDLSVPSKGGYSFDGWYLDSSFSRKTTSIISGSHGDLTLYAKWNPILHNVLITSADETMGMVSVSGDGYTDEEIIVSAVPNTDYVFDGWYSGDELISKDNPYAFIMPNDNYELCAHFASDEEAERRRSLGITPVLSADGKSLTYGLYPQTHVSDSSILLSLNSLSKPESNGWYKFNGEFYAKATGNPFKYGSCEFDDGTAIVSGAKYWFKCEPIVWNIVRSDENTYCLVSNRLLDTHEFNEYFEGTDENGNYSNNYANSSIRDWLNKTFYNAAFSLSSSLIQTAYVDNSASTTYYSINEYACDDIKDKVYLLSYQDYLNADYGFSTSAESSETRQSITTDWARANYGDDEASGDLCHYGWYWTRSPGTSNSNYVATVAYTGAISRGTAGGSNEMVLVRPAIQISREGQ